MDFIDEVVFWVQGGRGGNGCVSFRREKFVPKGGPDGGDGGRGGNVELKVNNNLSTLMDLRHRKRYTAGHGVPGRGKRMHGKNGKTIVITVPRGTMVFDHDTDTMLGDLTDPDQELTVVRGGRGGKGNVWYATPTQQTPDYAQPGKEGEQRQVRLELKLLADVGLVGFPNAGKSTFLSRVSAARPKIADYPFTTLVPNLGIVSYAPYKSFVMADIPGLIEGAHAGRGLGDRFLRHIERTRVLLFFIDPMNEDGAEQYRTLLEELRQFNPLLLDKPRMLAFSKIDLISKDDRAALPNRIDDQPCHFFSSVSGDGVQDLIDSIVELINLGN